MRVRDVPFVGAVIGSGADDRVFDGMLLAGPLVVAIIAVVGRSPLTVALAGIYIAVFLGHVLYAGLTS